MPGNTRDSAESLTAAAKADPCRLFNQSQLGLILHVSAKEIAVIKKAGAPFFGRYARPEWLVEWLKVHPTNNHQRRSA